MPAHRPERRPQAFGKEAMRIRRPAHRAGSGPRHDALGPLAMRRPGLDRTAVVLICAGLVLLAMAQLLVGFP
ncbi:hypothetical protein [Methylobacterium sp. WL7]|uniref:hypothetical protein n=1 Tax=Methylobacterium sp. WL7 TaxID=2603900 RepID=UPI0011C75311|nr:hypothetical protein [Methylobacterium sp. WL7]TXN44937.1 hypothetical protein FV233_12960 [Methylobacterium sp. WL7]